MISLKVLQQEKESLESEHTRISSQLAAIGGGYRDCWLDSAQNRRGTTYRRLRWFQMEADGRRIKRGRVLGEDEAVRARRAIALWAERRSVESRLGEVNARIQKTEQLIATLTA